MQQKPTKNVQLADDEEDEYDLRIKRTGCYDSHIKLQDCYFDKKDWRLCKEEMKAFKVCMDKYQGTEKDE
jgi:cytochrome c oxidase assembly factor 4